MVASPQAIAERATQAARHLARFWQDYWLIRELPWEGVIERYPELGKRAADEWKFAIESLSSCEASEEKTAEALVLLMTLADELALIHAYTHSERDFEDLMVSPSRSGLQALLRRSGLADWSARLGAPIHDEEGGPIGFGIGPIPGLMSTRDLSALVLTFSAPGAERASSDASRDFVRTLATAVPVCRDFLERYAAGEPLTAEYKRHLGEVGLDLIHTVRVAGAPMVRQLALQTPEHEDSLRLLMEQMSVSTLLGRYLLLIAVTNTLAELSDLEMFDTDDLRDLDRDVFAEMNS